MAEPLKNMYDEDFLRQFSGKVKGSYDAFNTEEFVTTVMDSGWDELKLKERIRRISESLGKYLPSQYADALDVLYAIDENCVGFPYLFFPDFVEIFGQAEEHWELSMHALKRFTSKSSAEFAVRSFLIRDPERMIIQMTAWAEDSSEHVRRLASEGCRPRLPWGQGLPLYKQNPTSILPILEVLKADPSLYVRKSVANNLNDIAKDHPSIVLDIARRWKGTDSNTDWIIRHGCRNLIRSAIPEALAIFGYSQSKNEGPLSTYASLSANPSTIRIGENCKLSYELHIRVGSLVKLRIEYGIDFVKAGGRISRKLFLLSDKTVAGGAHLSADRTHKWADLSTRRHYAGDHQIVLLLNGNEVANTSVKLEAAIELN